MKTKINQIFIKYVPIVWAKNCLIVTYNSQNRMCCCLIWYIIGIILNKRPCFGNDRWKMNKETLDDR